MTKMLGTKFSEVDGALMHWCPGCGMMHMIHIHTPNQQGAQWTFNGNVDLPTFTPSINVVGYCHYFITEGKLIYLDDCVHALKGQVIDFPDIPDDERW